MRILRVGYLSHRAFEGAVWNNSGKVLSMLRGTEVLNSYFSYLFCHLSLILPLIITIIIIFVVGWIVSFQMIRPSLKLGTYEHDLIWKQGLCRCTWLKMRSYWSGVGNNPLISVFTREVFWDGDSGQKVFERWELYCYKPRIFSNPWKLGEAKQKSPLEPSEEAELPLHSRLWASRAVREYTSLVLSHPLGGHLLWRNLETRYLEVEPCCDNGEWLWNC